MTHTRYAVQLPDGTYRGARRGMPPTPTLHYARLFTVRRDALLACRFTGGRVVDVKVALAE